MHGGAIFDPELATDAVADATDLPQRAAEWTAYAALHAGVFTRLQLRAWLQKPSPDAERAEASRIIASLRAQGLATEEDLAGIGPCVHIHAKQVYRALGETDNRNRRRPGREKAIERLLCLDYVLDHPDAPWLPTEDGKTQACEDAGIDRAAWPRKVYPAKDGPERDDAVLRREISAGAGPSGAASRGRVRQRGARPNARLKGWLDAYNPLLEAIAGAGLTLSLVHISQRPELAEPAARQLEQAARGLGDGDAEEAALERIRNAIRACSEEALESVGGLDEALETARRIFERRAGRHAGVPIQVKTLTWTSTRIADPEGAA